MRYDFSYIEAAHSRAHQARAEAVHRWIVAPLIAILRRASS